MKIKFLELALKNVSRNLRRTLITGMIIVFGSASLILAGGFIKYSFWGLGDRAIRGQYGHLQLFNPDFLEKEEDMPLEYGIDRPDSVIKIIQSIPEVSFAMPRIQFMGLISNGDKSVTFLGRAVIPELEQKLGGVSQEMEQGQHLNADETALLEHEVILTQGLAKSLKAEIGDYLTLLVTTTGGALNAMDVKLAGVFSTGVPELDAQFLNVKLMTAQELLRASRVSNIVVVLKETEDTDKAAKQLATVLEKKTIKKWSELDSFYRAVVKLYTAIFSFMGVIIFVVVLLASSNTMMMSIFERTREIGTLMAIGTSKKRILSNFLLEGLVIGTIAGCAGLLFSALASLIFNNAGIMMPPPPGSTLGYPLTIHYVPEIYIGTFIFMIFTAVLSTLFPAARAARTNIVDALGHI